MSQSHTDFSGSIPEIYDRCLGPLLFEFSAADLAERISREVHTGTVLEIACGTGISTRYLRQKLPASVEILATDLNPGMLDFARANRGNLSGVRYETADALQLPYEDQSFEGVACQYGIMFFPDIPKGLSEMLRVLKPGGFIACNVWDSLEANPVARLAHETIAAHFDSEPPSFLQVPFGSCALEPTLELFKSQGFQNVQAHAVEATIERPSAREVAQGFVEGNPGVLEINARANASSNEIVDKLAHTIEKEFGPDPLRFPLREFVFTGNA